MNDLDLLRQYEPIVKFTYGENFFPTAVDGYVRRCSLWRRDEKGLTEQVLEEGELNLEKLAELKEAPLGESLSLRFVQEQLDVIEYERWRMQPDRPRFHSGGRLSRVGLLPRLLVSFFNLSLLVRGRVPGGTTAAAAVKYEQMRKEDPRMVYYGRVVREAGYIVLQYMFFYAMNDWRSSFYGVNDHEADLEQIFVYLSDEVGGPPQPCWVAYASHDFFGDDLRRRWDDPELHRQGDHPIIYVGAGSHASYFLPGEYLMGAEPEFIKPIRRAARVGNTFWKETLGQGQAERTLETEHSQISVPFIDYARGDGLAIGPGQELGWSPILLTKQDEWAEKFRGLWGLDTRDFLGGERAPAGPKFNRDGSVRVSWYDPLGWAGLDKTPPPGQTAARLQHQIASLDQRRLEAEIEIEQKRDALRQMAIELRALQQANHLDELYKEKADDLDQDLRELQSLYARHTRLVETGLAAQSYLAAVERGEVGDPQAHIRHKHMPQPPLPKQSGLLEFWAAVSGGVLLLALVGLLYFHPDGWPIWLAVALFSILAVEAAVRGRLVNFLLTATMVLGVITALVLVVDFFWLLVVLALAALVVYSVFSNLREMAGR